jgi:hypothetical protein
VNRLTALAPVPGSRGSSFKSGLGVSEISDECVIAAIGGGNVATARWNWYAADGKGLCIASTRANRLLNPRPDGYGHGASVATGERRPGDDGSQAA